MMHDRLLALGPPATVHDDAVPPQHIQRPRRGRVVEVEPRVLPRHGFDRAEVEVDAHVRRWIRLAQVERSARRGQQQRRRLLVRAGRGRARRRDRMRERGRQRGVVQLERRATADDHVELRDVEVGDLAVALRRGKLESRIGLDLVGRAVRRGRGRLRAVDSVVRRRRRRAVALRRRGRARARVDERGHGGRTRSARSAASNPRHARAERVRPLAREIAAWQNARQAANRQDNARLA